MLLTHAEDPQEIEKEIVLGVHIWKSWFEVMIDCLFSLGYGLLIIKGWVIERINKKNELSNSTKDRVKRLWNWAWHGDNASWHMACLGPGIRVFWGEGAQTVCQVNSYDSWDQGKRAKTSTLNSVGDISNKIWIKGVGKDKSYPG